MTTPSAPVTRERARGLAALAVAYATALAVGLAVGWGLRRRDPVLVALAADLAATLTVFAFSVRHDNSSIYDPYWSVAPIPIALYWASVAGGGSGLRRSWVLAVICLWGARLTANQLQRWGGVGHEDFRYRELRARARRWYWPLSLAGVHLLPTIWVFLGLLAAYPALAGRGGALRALDAVAVVVAGGAVLLEAVADWQLRRFRRVRDDPAAVLVSGLWAVCRHPNYLGEILFWWGIFLSGVAAEPRWAWAALGPLAITLVFLRVSVPWMDRHLAARHPGWAERVRGVPALLPWRRAWRGERAGARSGRHG
jgi:steroid 5-alpha reductase family enzyme